MRAMRNYFYEIIVSDEESIFFTYREVNGL